MDFDDKELSDADKKLASDIIDKTIKDVVDSFSSKEAQTRGGIQAMILANLIARFAYSCTTAELGAYFLLDDICVRAKSVVVKNYLVKKKVN